VALTQRVHPRMAAIVPERDGDGWSVRAEGFGSVRLRLAGSERRAATVWSDTVDSARGDAEGAAWVSEFLGLPAAFVAMTGPDRTAALRTGGEAPVSFADVQQLLVLGEASLAELNGRLDRPVGLRNFRPNVVVSGTEPFAEDAWKEVVTDDVVLEVVRPCGRCVLTTVDPETCERHPRSEPLRTLATYRRTTPETGTTNFGVLAAPRRCGTLRVGDVLQVT